MLPIAAVLDFLDNNRTSGQVGRTEERGLVSVPHLLFTASLEPDTQH